MQHKVNSSWLLAHIAIINFIINFNIMVSSNPGVVLGLYRHTSSLNFMNVIFLEHVKWNNQRLGETSQTTVILSDGSKTRCQVIQLWQLLLAFFFLSFRPFDKQISELHKFKKAISYLAKLLKECDLTRKMLGILFFVSKSRSQDYFWESGSIQQTFLPLGF